MSLWHDLHAFLLFLVPPSSPSSSSSSQVAKRKTLFDDKPVEISELTFIIKQDIAKLNKQIAELQDHIRSSKAPSKQASEHSNNVVVLLQSKLANTSMSFKDILEIRTQVSMCVLRDL